MNQTVEKIIGIRRKRIIGKSISNLAKMGFFIEAEINNYLDSIPSIIENKGAEPFEMNIIDKNGQELYFEIYSSILSSEEHGSTIQFIGHDITSRVEAEEQRGELIREKARVELYGFVVSAVPVFASSIPPQLRNTIIKNFADRFEKNVKPNFINEMSTQGFLDIIKKHDIQNNTEIFNAYLVWISDLLSNLGIKTRIIRTEPKIKLEFITFPWIDEARKNPIFTLIFRAMIIRSFTWTGLKGTVTQTSSLLEGSKNIKFEFYIPN